MATKTETLQNLTTAVTEFLEQEGLLVDFALYCRDVLGLDPEKDCNLSLPSGFDNDETDYDDDVLL